PDDDRMPDAQHAAGRKPDCRLTGAGSVGLRTMEYFPPKWAPVRRRKCDKRIESRAHSNSGAWEVIQFEWNALQAKKRGRWPPCPSSGRSTASGLSAPGEGDLVERPDAELLGGASHRAAPQRAVELDRRLVVRQCPHDQALEPALREVAARGGEQAAAEPQP